MCIKWFKAAQHDSMRLKPVRVKIIGGGDWAGFQGGGSHWQGDYPEMWFILSGGLSRLGIYPEQGIIMNMDLERGFILKIPNIFCIHVFTINRLRSPHVMQQSSASIQCRQTVSRSATPTAGCVRWLIRLVRQIDSQTDKQTVSSDIIMLCHGCCRLHRLLEVTQTDAFAWVPSDRLTTDRQKIRQSHTHTPLLLLLQPLGLGSDSCCIVGSLATWGTRS